MARDIPPSWQTASKVSLLFLEYCPKWSAAQKFLLRGPIEGFDRIGFVTRLNFTFHLYLLNIRPGRRL